MSQIKVNSIIPAGGLPSGANGGIIQTVHTIKNDKMTWDTNGDVAVTGMSVTITPSSNANKVLIHVEIGAAGVHQPAFPVFWKLYKGGSAIAAAKGNADGGGSDPVGCASYTKNAEYYTGTSTSFSYLDTPGTTSATTYALYGQRHSSAGIVYFNSTGQDINERYARSIASITATEISV